MKFIDCALFMNVSYQGIDIYVLYLGGHGFVSCS